MPAAASEYPANEARNRIVEILDESVQHALDLKDCLDDERRSLQAQDAASLSAVIENKGQYINKLQTLENERARLTAACGFGPGPQQMDQLQDWCDQDASIAESWQRLMKVAAQCNDLNMSNGAIIRVRKQQFESSLSIIRGGNPETDTYGRHGTESGGQHQRPLAEA